MDRVTEADMEYQNDTNIQTYVSIIELPASRRTHHSVFSLQFFSLHSFKMTRRRDKESSRPSKIGNSWVRRQVYQCPVLGFISGHRWWFRFMHLHLPTPFPLPLSSISYSYCDIIIAYHSSVACHSITTMTGTRRGHLIHSCASTPFIDDVALLLLFPLPPCAPFKPPPLPVADLFSVYRPRILLRPFPFSSRCLSGVNLARIALFCNVFSPPSVISF